MNGIGTLPWQAQSPDRNIIENVWKTIKIRVHRRISEIENADKLKLVLQEIWTALPQHYIKGRIQKLPKGGGGQKSVVFGLT